MHDLSWYLLKLGTFGFGGPIALVARMRNDLVDEDRISESEFDEAVSFSQLAPGPLAAQVASYLGWLKGGGAGALSAGLAFVLPSLLMVIGLSWAYVRYGGLPWLQHVFYGVGGAVIAIIAKSALQFGRKTVGGDGLLWLIFAANTVVTALLAAEIFLLVVLSGVVFAFLRTPVLRSDAVLSLMPYAVLTPAAGEAGTGLFSILLFFAKTSLFVFGSGLAIVPFLYGGVVETNHWLTEREFVDAIAISMITPGPVVITVAFIGYLLAGLSGGLVAAAGIFLPVWLTVAAFAPFYRRVQRNQHMHNFVRGVTAAVAGALAGAVIVIGIRTITDLTVGLIALSALVLISSRRVRVPEPVVVVFAGMVGVALHAR